MAIRCRYICSFSTKGFGSAGAGRESGAGGGGVAGVFVRAGWQGLLDVNSPVSSSQDCVVLNLKLISPIRVTQNPDQLES